MKLLGWDLQYYLVLVFQLPACYFICFYCRGYLLSPEGKERLKEAGMGGAYLGEDGRVHVPGRKVTLYSKPSPPQEEALKLKVSHLKQTICVVKDEDTYSSKSVFDST